MPTLESKLTNLSQFTPKGGLGILFTQARAYNQVNSELRELLPSELNRLELCLIKAQTATLITGDQAVAFRAQKQNKLLLSLLTSLEGLSQIKKIVVKVNLKEC